MVAQAFNPSSRDNETGELKIASPQVYTISSGSARATYRDPVSKNKTSGVKWLSGSSAHLACRKPWLPSPAPRNQA